MFVILRFNISCALYRVLILLIDIQQVKTNKLLYDFPFFSVFGTGHTSRAIFICRTTKYLSQIFNCWFFYLKINGMLISHFHHFSTYTVPLPHFFCLSDFSCCSFCSARPSLIEYLSYNLNFLSVLVGPCSNYKDYIDFIEGRHVGQRLRQHSGTCNGQNGYDKSPDPSPVVSSWMQLCSNFRGVNVKWQ